MHVLIMTNRTLCNMNGMVSGIRHQYLHMYRLFFSVCSMEASLFEVEQLTNSRVALKAPNGKYVTIKMTGALNCISDSCGDKEKFKVFFIVVDRVVSTPPRKISSFLARLVGL